MSPVALYDAADGVRRSKDVSERLDRVHNMVSRYRGVEAAGRWRGLARGRLHGAQVACVGLNYCHEPLPETVEALSPRPPRPWQVLLLDCDSVPPYFSAPLRPTAVPFARRGPEHDQCRDKIVDRC